MIGNVVAGLLGGAASPPFDPSSIANLKLWLDASDTATISLSGSAVTQWNDKSGNAKHVTQATSARRPSSGINTINSKNVITFGGDDLLQAASAADWAFLHNSGGSTVFAVSISDNTAAAEFPIFATSTGSSQIGCAFRIAYDPPLDKFSPFVSTGGGSGTLVSLIAAGGVTVGTAFYASGIWDNSNATLANRSLWRQNGGTQEGANSQDDSPVGTNPANALIIGCNNTAGTTGYTGKIAEILLYSGVLTGTDVTNVNSYLSAKWGI
jgi:hypothetical protein